MSDSDDADGPSRRQLAKAKRRNAGDRSSELARTLMKINAATLEKLELEAEFLEVVVRARAITAQVARRRAERTVAGELRRIDQKTIEVRLANVQSTGVAEPELFHLAERWRERLIGADGEAAAAEFAGGREEPMPRLIAQARREQDTGRPPGAKRALFRHVLEVLKSVATPESASEPNDEEDE